MAAWQAQCGRRRAEPQVGARVEARLGRSAGPRAAQPPEARLAGDEPRAVWRAETRLALELPQAVVPPAERVARSAQPLLSVPRSGRRKWLHAAALEASSLSYGIRGRSYSMDWKRSRPFWSGKRLSTDVCLFWVSEAPGARAPTPCRRPAQTKGLSRGAAIVPSRTGGAPIWPAGERNPGKMCRNPPSRRCPDCPSIIPRTHS